MCFLAAFVAGACEADQTPADQTTLDPMNESPQQMSGQSEQAIGGALETVDLDTRTFTVSTDGGAQTFVFTDATEVTGGGEPQGLAGREGARVMVTYRDDQGSRIATRIEFQ
jgi:hypothetical protein